VNTISDEVVKRKIAMSMSGDGPTISRVARLLNISVRSLQRKLQQGGTNYNKFVAEVRYETACRLLDAPDTSIAEVAAALGYADPSSFSRSFARWSGMQPRAYRASPARRGHLARHPRVEEPLQSENLPRESPE
jgi:AraC-like DNA-binding protein